MSTTLLQLFLMVIVFLMGALATIAIQQGYAHFHPHPHEAEKPHAIDGTAEKGGHLPAAVKERLVQQSQASFQAILDKSAEDLEHDLERTGSELNKVLQKIGTEVVGNEMERYRLQLDMIRKEAATAIGNAQDEIDQHQTELKAKLQEEQDEVRAKLAEEISQARAKVAGEITAEKQRAVQEIMAEKQQVMAQVDTKLADAMASFLLESLGHNVDLGAQTAYLTAQLEEHKDDFKRSVSE